jgi:hypothetical protein
VGAGGSGMESARASEEAARMNQARIALRRDEAIWRPRHGEERRRRSLEKEAGGTCVARGDGIGALNRSG